MIRKSFPIIFLFILTLVGVIILTDKNNSSQVIAKRSYIIATATGNSNYPHPLPFQAGTKVITIVSAFSNSWEKIYRRQGTRLIPIDLQQEINTDIQIKIT